MMVPKHIFRAYDIRGIYNVDLNVNIASLIGLAIATYANDDFIVGNDIRKSSIPLKLAIISGILSSGYDVYDIGTVPIGAAFFSVINLKRGNLAYVTASHLPPEWNGLKLCHNDGLYYAPNEIYKIRDLILANKLNRATWKEIGKVSKINILDDYIDFLLSIVKINKLRVVLDLGNGATALVAPKVFRGLGLDVYTLFENIDPSFSGRGPEPSPETLRILSKTVVSLKADVGIAYDGDGDRVMFTDENGNVLLPEQAAIVMMEGGLKGTIVISADCSQIIEEYAEKYGIKVVRVPVGHTYMVRKVIETNAVLGIEHSGHFTIGEYSKFDDGILASLKFSEMVSLLEKPISKIVPKTYPYIRTKVEVDDLNKFKVVEKLREKYEREYGHVDILDGVRITAEDYWVLIRASNTEPIIRITIECKREDITKELCKKFYNDVKSMYSKIKSQYEK